MRWVQKSTPDNLCTRTMITFKSGALKKGGDRTGVELPSESSQGAIRTLSDADPPTTAVKPSLAQPVELSPEPHDSPAPRKIERFYSEDWKMERWILFIFSLPLSSVIGLAFYLFFTGTSQWLVGAVMLVGFAVFGLAGFLIEQQSLKQFACPRCEAPIEDWDTNETHRILFRCDRCNSSWDIEFKPYPEPELRPSHA